MKRTHPVVIIMILVISSLSFTMVRRAAGSGDGSGPVVNGGGAEIFSPVASFVGSTSHYGYSFDIGGDIAVGDARGGVNSESHAGIAYIYERDEATGGWSEVKQLHAPFPHECAHLGAAVTVTEEADTIIVGEEGRRDHPACKQDGAIYFFSRDEGGIDAWGLVKTIEPPHDSEFDRYFGCAVAIGGNRLAVGAPDYGEMGMAYVYDAEADWGMVGSFAGFQRWNTLGFAAAVSADDFIIGAPFEWAPNLRDHLGHVYPGSPTPLPYPMPVTDGSYEVGRSLALEGDLLAVSYDPASESVNREDVLIYRRTAEGDWELV